jgi:RimJ/RimL family protein N-acetyltransferase
MFSDRLRYRPVTLANLGGFHSLVQDEQVRRYLMDGNLFPQECSGERVRESEGLFERRGAGLWLVTDITTNELVGFCGFLEIPAIHLEPQLVYAMFERFSGKGVRHRDVAHFDHPCTGSVGLRAGNRQR